MYGLILGVHKISVKFSKIFDKSQLQTYLLQSLVIEIFAIRHNTA